jgi:hypothetical protein
MKRKTYLILLYCTLGICVALTLAHLIYDIYAYQHSSIIYFISKELW